MHRFLTALLVFFGPAFAIAENTSLKTEDYVQSTSKPISMARPNGVSGELGGRGILYSVNYDRSITPAVGLGIGLMQASLSTGTWRADITGIPAYANFYFSPNKNRGFLTGGATLFNLSVKYRSSSTSTSSGMFDVTPSGDSVSALVPTVGGGYELHGPFLFRVAAYALVGRYETLGWAGVSFGGTF